MVRGAPSALPLALTMGEPAGIGPDITIMIWLRRRALQLPPFYLIADTAMLRARANALDVECPMVETAPDGAVSIFDRALPIVPLVQPVSVRPGEVSAANAAAVLESIRRAVDDTQSGSAAAVVTNPIHKATLTAAGFRHAGHTEFLAELAATTGVPPPRAVMMLAGPMLRTVPVTVHIPLHAVAATLSADLIVDASRIVAADLTRRFGIAAPRLAVAGLNPHAGEGGTIGDEDERIVRPAVARLRAEGIEAMGPVPADSLFRDAALPTYDAAICMYHDQALIPVKALAFAETVNVTLGLPFVRTSPDHGTALEIAGSGRADAGNLAHALWMAETLAVRAAAE